MKNKKMCASILLILMLVITILIIPNSSKATEQTVDLYFSRKEVREKSTPKANMGFAIHQPQNDVSKTGTNIWKFVKHNSKDSVEFDDTINFYCVKDGVGFSLENKTVQYDKSFDFVADKEVMKAKTGDTTLQSIVNNDDAYYGIIALADLVYVKGAANPNGTPSSNVSTNADKEKLLTDAGIDLADNKLSDDMIDAIQQAAFWYFSNYEDENGAFTNCYDNYRDEIGDEWLTYKISGEQENYTSITEGALYSEPDSPEAEERGEQVSALYRYLVGTAKENATKYKNGARKSKNIITLFTNWTGEALSHTQPLISIQKIHEFDLALRKYITKVDGVDVSTLTGSRAPSITATEINNSGTAIYNHRKDPVKVKKGSKVTYNITIYNEGDVAGIATEITDQLPKELKYKEGSIDSNSKYTASYDSASNKIKFTRKNVSDPLQPYTGGSNLASETITFVCEVNEESSNSNETKILTNIAWISKAKNTEKDLDIAQPGDERDSLPTADHSPNKQQNDLPTYHGNDANPGANNSEAELGNSGTFFKGQEDDDDFEKLKLLPNNFDLALTKAIYEVNGKRVDERITNENVDKLKAGTLTDMENDKNDTPVKVKKGDIIKYRIRVYNEGDVAGYASEVTDDIPDGLEFIYSLKSEDEINQDTTLSDLEKEAMLYNQLVWAPDELEDETPVAVSDYLAKGNGADLVQPGSNLLKAFDKNKDFVDTEEDKNPDYRDLYIYMKVISENKKGTTIRNEAAITGNTDANGQDIIDRDSQPENWPGREPSHNYQDEEDYDILELQEFDLALTKAIYEVNGERVDERITNENVDKLKAGTLTDMENDKNDTPVKVKKGDIVKYRIRVYNEGDVAGYASEVTDDIPDGLEFIYSSKTEDEINQDTTLSDLEKEAILWNKTYWTPDELDDGTPTAVSDYLAKGKGADLVQPGSNLLKAFDGNKNFVDTENDKNPDYRDLYIYMKVISEDKRGTTIRNEAAITDDTDENGNEAYDRDSEPENWPGREPSHNYQDEEDYDILELQEFDLALRKFITAVSSDETIEENEKLMDEEDSTKYAREPKVDTSLLNTEGDDGKTVTTATYEHSKEPLVVNKNDYIVYMLRVYNEGDFAGYATKITDYLPDGLDYVDGEFNKQYGWSYDAEKRTVSTEYLKNELINAPTEVSGKLELDYAEVPIMCRLNATVKNNVNQTNIAEIAEDKDYDKKDVDDRDSEPDNLVEPDETDKPKYKNEESDEPYVPGQQDDDDFEKVLVKPFDLALRKFITKVENNVVDSRIPQLSWNEEENRIQYTHPKEEAPVEVVTGNVVEYTIRVFNEGSRDGYASQILDDIPEGLEFLPENETNKTSRWVMYRKLRDGEVAEGDTITQDNVTYVKAENANEAEVIVTDYLSMEQGEARMGADDKENPALLTAYDEATGITDTNPDYADVKVAFKVTEPGTSNRIVVNSAQISEDTDENGKDIDDDDSEPGIWNDGEDDQDKEYVKVDYFDLALRKWVTQAIVVENGKQTVTQTGHYAEQDPEPIVKVDLNRKKLNQVTVKFRYSIRITNQGNIAGYAKEITDYVPEGLKFVAEDNPGWTDEGNNVISTKLLADKLLQPGESADIEVLLTWINKEDNMGLKTNTAEISEDYNDQGVPDIDSTPDNKKPEEDDIDDAPVMLSIKTGRVQVYIVLGLSILITVAGGIVLIKKYVI